MAWLHSTYLNPNRDSHQLAKTLFLPNLSQYYVIRHIPSLSCIEMLAGLQRRWQSSLFIVIALDYGLAAEGAGISARDWELSANGSTIAGFPSNRHHGVGTLRWLSSNPWENHSSSFSWLPPRLQCFHFYSLKFAYVVCRW